MTVPMSAIPFSPEEAERHKIVFYCLPQDLDLENIDPLMRPIVRMINASGWVWTAECCQGHPDYDGSEPGWDHNTDPFLRLVVSLTRLGDMMGALTSAMRLPDLIDGVSLEKMRSGATCSFHTHIWPYPLGLWEQVNVYVKAHNVLMRDSGIEALTRFASLISTQREAKP